MSSERTKPRRRPSSKALRSQRRSAKPSRAEYQNLRNPFPPVELFSADRIEAIHETSLTILAEMGLRILHPQARALLSAAGCHVDESEQRVRFDRDFIDDRIAQAPSSVTLVSRNPSRHVEIGGNSVAFATVGGPPNVSDLELGRRPGTLRDFRDLMRLAQAFDVIHVLGPAVEPLDVPIPHRHLDFTHTQLTLSEKIPFVFSRGKASVADAFELMRIAHGSSADEFRDVVTCYTVVNANSPLQLDVPMCQGIIDFARAGQLMVLTPFTLAGAMAPVTIAGALAQQNAEALAGISLSQVVRAGAPIAYGGFTSNVDMRSGAPAFGTPEYVHAAFATGQLARRYGVPWRSSNVNASNHPDAQAVYESQMAIWGAMLGGCHLLMHGAGWLEGGLTASFEKFVIDVEMLQMFARLFRPVDCDTAALALDAVREVGPGGHYFGAAHTLERYENAFYAPLLSDWRNFESWREDGSVDATQRAHRVYKETLRDFEQPPMDVAMREAMDEFVARRKAEGGAPPDG